MRVLRRNLKGFFPLAPPDPLSRHHSIAAPFAVRDHRASIDQHMLDADWRRLRMREIRGVEARAVRGLAGP